MPKTPGFYRTHERLIRELYLSGVPVAIIAEHLGLKRRVLNQRIHEWGLPDLREIEQHKLARRILKKYDFPSRTSSSTDE